MTQNVQTEIIELRRCAAGLSRSALTSRARVHYGMAWRRLTNKTAFPPAEVARLLAVLDDADLEQRDARSAIAVLQTAYSAEV
jgi:hypothetical protein